MTAADAASQYRDLVAELERLAIDLATLEICARHDEDLAVDRLSSLVDRALALLDKHQASNPDPRYGGPSEDKAHARHSDDSDQRGAVRRVFH